MLGGGTADAGALLTGGWARATYLIIYRAGWLAGCVAPFSLIKKGAEG
jgi:hypothetical protein